MYSIWVGFIFIFNLIMGVGALSLPHAFFEAGLLLGSIFLIFMAFLSFMTATFVIEAISLSNYFLIHTKNQLLNSDKITEKQGLLAEQIRNNYNSVSISNTCETCGCFQHYSKPFEIRQQTEISLMAELYLGIRGKAAFYIVLIAYLVGDLAIYVVAVADTLAHFASPFDIAEWHFDHDGAYQFFVCMFALFIVPFCFFDFAKTRWLQLFTLVSRNVAMFSMIGIAVSQVFTSSSASSISDMPWFNINRIPLLYGVAVYSFMCHHSIPALITPIREKGKLRLFLFFDFVLVCAVLLLLSWSAVAAFGGEVAPECPSVDGHPCILQSLYTLNFSSYHVRILAQFLILYPVFTLTTNYPLIAITLRNNLQTLYTALNADNKQHTVYTISIPEPSPPVENVIKEDNTEDASKDESADSMPLLTETPKSDEIPISSIVTTPVGTPQLSDRTLSSRGLCFYLSSPKVNKMFFSFIASVPPIAIGLLTSEIDVFISLTASFAGIGIQYVMPVWLVWVARNKFHSSNNADKCHSLICNPYSSPFQHTVWLILILVWTTISFGLGLSNQICNLMPDCYWFT